MAENSDKETIIIDLDKVRDVQPYKDPNEIIQQEAMQRFFEHIDECLKRAKKYKKKLEECPKTTNLYDPPESLDDTITIIGRRGSGKTTFIQNMFNLIHEDKVKDIIKNPDINDGTIETIGVIDPTLINGGKEFLFLNIVARIKESVDEHQKKSCKDNKHTKGEYNDWLESLRMLAKGLSCEDGFGQNFLDEERWNDPTHVMEKALVAVSDNNKLEKHFHEFINNSLKLLNKKAFIIAFDDIDTSFSVGWSVLEVIRKHMTSPQIITVMLGDIQLYQKLVRLKQWDNFGDTLFKSNVLSGYEKNKAENFIETIDELEDQYLLKLLKPEKRISLKTIYEVRKDHRIEIKYKHNEKNAEINHSIKTFIKDVLFITNLSDKDIYKEYLLNDTTRSLVQLLYAYYTCQKDGKFKADFMVERLIDIFTVHLQKYGFDTYDLKNPQEKTILSIIVSNLAKHNLLSHGYRLKADLEKRSENNCMLAVGAVLSNMFRKKPQLYFDYMIKAGLTSEVYNFTDNLTTRAVHRNNFTERFKGYMDYTGLSQADTALTISRFSSIYFRDKVKPTSSAIRRTTYSKPAPSIFRGTAVLYRNNPTDDTSLLINDCINDKAKSHAYLAAFPMFLSINEKGRREPLYSIWSLLAVIGELIREARSDKNDDEAIQKLMIKAKVLAQTRDYPTPTATDYRSSDFEEDDEEDTGETNNKNQPESSDETDKQTYKFFETFLEWAKKDDNNRNVPIYVMGRIYSRLYYTLTSIDADAKSKNKFLGEIFHRFIIAFLNAVLVEEALNKQDIEEVQLNNPVTSDNIFINNLKKTEKTAFPFFDWIVSCPVWLLYLNSNSDVFKKISGKEEGNKEGLYTLLNKVKIKSSKEKKEEKKKEKKKRRRPLYKNDAKLLKEFVQNMNDGKRDIIKLTTMIKKKCRELFNDEYNNKPSPTALKKCEQIVKDVLNKE